MRQDGWIGLLALGMVGLCVVSVGTGAVVAADAGLAASTAPDCSSVSYEGNGTAQSPYEIATLDQLQCLDTRDLNASYEQVADIDASETAGWNSGKGFAPLTESSSSDPAFGGEFDGNDHAILNLTIERSPQSGVGLFEATTATGVVRDVTLVNATVVGESVVGGVVGKNRGTVNRSSVSGSVTGSFFDTGGIAGNNTGAINRSYAVSSVTGSDIVGGLVGSNSGTLTRSYAAGNVTAADFAGGLVGIQLPGNSVDRLYWDRNATGQNGPSAFESFGTGLTTAEMTGDAVQTNMSGLAFGTVWTTAPGDYPELLAGRSNFQVSALSPVDATVTNRTTVDISATVTNTGNDEGTQAVSLFAGGVSRTQNRTLGSGEQVSVAFSLDTGRLGPGTYTHEVATANDSANGSLVVEKGPTDPTFLVTDLTPADVTVANETALNISASVENVGARNGTQTVTLSVGGVDATRNLTLESGERETVTFGLDTEQLGPGEYTHQVASANTSVSGNLTVRVVADFRVSSLDPASVTVENGTDLDITAEVTNTGSANGTQTLTLSVGGVTSNRNLTLRAGEQGAVTFDLDTGQLGPGNYTHEVVSANDSASGTLTVEPSPTAPTFDVNDLDPAETALGNGTNLRVSAEIENIGNQNGTQTLTLSLDGLTPQETTLSLAGRETATVDFGNLYTGPLDPGTYTYEVTTANDTASGTLTLLSRGDITAPNCGNVTYSGDGTPTAPYEVRTVDQLQCLAGQDPTASYEQVVDIDATGTDRWNNGSGFEPIQSSGERFSGTFDGNGHEIAGLTAARPSARNVGLFSRVAETGVATSVALTDVSITGSTGVGSIAGYAGGTVSNSSATGRITAQRDTAGGLVGSTGLTGRVRHSEAAVRVRGRQQVGGLVGVNFAGEIAGSHAVGRVTGSSADSLDSGLVGGLVGELGDESTVTESYATGAVDAPFAVGGLVGMLDNGGTVTDSYATGPVTGGGAMGGLAGAMDRGTIVGSYATGNVTGSNGGGLVGSMDFGATVRNSHATGRVAVSGTGGGLVADIYNGTVTNSYATGTVDGGDGVGGLVGTLAGKSGSVTDSYATGRVNGSNEVGGLLGLNDIYGTVTGSHATGRVTGVNATGGLVGRNLATTRRSYSTGRVTGSWLVGGLVGDNNLRDTVSRSYATGSVTGENYVGGLVGRNQGTVRRSYTAANVSGGGNTGGLIGSNSGDDVTIERSYWDRNATGQDTSGGGTELTTAEMTGPAAVGTMDLDFGGVWTTLPDDYPVLLGVPVGAQLSPRPALDRRPVSPVVNETVTFDASGSVDLNGDPLSYEWTFGADNTTDATGPTVSRTYESNGTRQVALTVSDGNLSANLTESFEVYRASAVPNASFVAGGPKVNTSGGTVTVPAGVPVRLNGSASTAPDGRSLDAHTWSFGPGQTATGETVFHRFDATGTDTARLRVTDSAGVTDTVRRTVNVTEPDGPVIVNVTQPANGIIPQSPNPIFGIPSTWRVNATSNNPISEVTFEFPGTNSEFTRTDTDGGDGWAVTLDPTVLNFNLGDGTLDITVEDESGNTTEQTVEIETFELPRWGSPYIVSDNPALPGSNDTLEGGIRVGPPPLGFPLVVDIELDASVKPSVTHPLGTRTASLGGGGKLALTVIPPVGPGVGVSGEATITGNATIEEDRLRVQQVASTVTLKQKLILVILAVNTPVGEFQVTGSLEVGNEWGAEVNTTGNLSLSSGDLSVLGTLVPLQIKAGANVGPVTIISSSVGGKASGSGTIETDLDSINGTLSGSGKLFAKLQAVGFRFKKEVGPSKTIPVFNITSENNWQRVDKHSGRPALTDRVGTAGGQTETTRLTNDTLADRTPAIVTDPAGQTIVWARQDPDLTTLNGTELVVRRGTDQNATTTQVTDDRRYDTSPSLTRSGVDTDGNVTRGVAWSRARSPVDNETTDEPMELLAELETHVALLNRSTSELSSMRLTNDSVPDIETTIAGLDTGDDGRSDAWLVAWVEESDANLTTTADRRVEYAFLGPNAETVRTRGTVTNATAVDTTTAGQRLVLVTQTTATETPAVRRVAFAPNGSRLGETSYTTPTVTDVAAVGETTAWTAGIGGQQRIHTRTDSHNRTLRDLPGDPAGVELSRAGDRQILSYRARTNDSSTSTVYTHTRTAVSGWSQPHPIQTGEIPLRRPAVTATPETVTTAFESTPNLSTRADIVTASRPYTGPNLTVTARSRGVGLSAGSVLATVTNTGGRPAAATTLTVEPPAGNVTDLPVPALGPGERTSRELSVPRPLAGVARVTVADPSSVGTAPNDRAQANLTADVVLGNVRDRLTADRSTLVVSADLVNTGPLPARDVPYRVQVGNQTVTGTVDALAVDRTQTISARIDADSVATGEIATLTVAPNGTVPDPTPGDSRRQGPVRQPDTGVLGTLQTGTPAGGYGQPVGMTLSSGDTAAPVARVEVNATGGNGTGAVYEVPLPPARSSGDSVYTSARLAVPSVPDNGSLCVTSAPRQARDTDLTNGRASEPVETPEELGPHLTVTDAQATLNDSVPVVVLELVNPAETLVGELVRVNTTDGVTRRVPVAVQPGESRSVEVPVPTWNSSSAVVQTVDETVVVDRPAASPEFTVESIDTNTPVTAGQNLTVTTLVENVGGGEGTRTLTLSVGALGNASTDVTLGGNESAEQTLSVGTGDGDAGNYTATVVTGDDEATTSVTVTDQPSFTVGITGTNAPVTAGESLSVTAVVSNPGPVGSEQVLELDAGPLGSESRTVQLDSGDTAEQTVTFDSGTNQTGTYSVTATVGDNSTTTTVELVPTSLADATGPPTDPDGDGTYEDTDGDGTVDITDVQTFFDALDTVAVRQHPPAFDFDGDDRISIFDVQALFEQLKRT